MKIVSFNVNGLRPRAKEFGGLKQLLDALDADVICLQETKVARPDLSADVAIADGYESFFAFPRGKHARSGWSGVATFCRSGGVAQSCNPVLPIAAEEGFTGVAHLRAGEGVVVDGGIGSFDAVWAGAGGSRARLEELDAEGRVVVTDHGAFVLFNIYGPCVQPGDDERIAFKLDFYHTLQRRWESLLSLGRRVVVVGDLNIAPGPMDSVHVGPDWRSSPSRMWLHSQLRVGGGPFTDTFRALHPHRSDAYTCFSIASGAAAFNYGSRIDLVLLAGPCQHAQLSGTEKARGKKEEGREAGGNENAHTAVDGAEGAGPSGRDTVGALESDVIGSGRTEERAQSLGVRLDGATQPDGKTTVSGGLSGSLQAHLFEEFRDAVCTSGLWADSDPQAGTRIDVGAAASDEVGREESDERRRVEATESGVGETQASQTGVPRIPEDEPCSCSGHSSPYGFAECAVLDADIMSPFPGSSDHRPVFVRLKQQADGPMHKVPPLSTRFMPELRGKQTRIVGYFGSGARSSAPPTIHPLAPAASLPPPLSAAITSSTAADRAGLRADVGRCESDPGVLHSGVPAGVWKQGVEPGRKRKGGQISRPAKQRSLRELFGPLTAKKTSSQSQSSCTHLETKRVAIDAEAAGDDTWRESGGSVSVVATSTAVGDGAGAAAGWAVLRQRMAAAHPLCRHGEPAVARVVKKAGPTVGRTFYCCARATGPSSNPEARCDYFEWALSNTARSRGPSARSH